MHPPSQASPDFGRSHVLKHIWPLSGVSAFFVAFFLIGIPGYFEYLSYPMLIDEDALIFDTFYREHTFGNIFTFYNGYVRVLPYLLGYLLHFLPLAWLPYGYVLVSMVFTALTGAVFYRVVLRLNPDPWLALILLMGFCLLPFGNYQFVSTLMYQIWNLLFLLFLMLFIDPPRTPVYRILLGLATILMIVSHPLSLVLLPVYCLRAWKFQDSRVENVLYVATGITYYFVGISHNHESSPPLEYLLNILLDRVVVEGLVGPQMRSLLQYLGVEKWVSLLLLIVLVGSIRRMWKKLDLRQQEWFLVSAYFTVAGLMASLAGRNLALWEFYASLGGSVRYVYIPKILFFTAAVLVTYPWVSRIYWAPVVVSGFAVIIFWMNLASWPVYQIDYHEARHVKRFIEILEEGQFECRSGESRSLDLKKNGEGIGWDTEDPRLKVEVCSP